MLAWVAVDTIMRHHSLITCMMNGVHCYFGRLF